MSLPLEDLQARFAAAVLDASRATGVEGAVASPRVRERVALYRGNLVAAYEKALAGAYPVVRELVGEAFFAGLLRAYARAHPGSSGDLHAFGANLAAFVADFAPARSLAYLADVAALEWRVHCARRAADGRPLSRERIGAFAAGDLLAARFALHPACAWIGSRFAIARIWLAHQPRAAHALPVDVDEAEIALVVRPQWRVGVLVASPGEIAALTVLRGEGDMEAAIAAGLQADAAFDFPKALVRWIDSAVLVAADD